MLIRDCVFSTRIGLVIGIILYNQSSTAVPSWKDYQINTLHSDGTIE